MIEVLDDIKRNCVLPKLCQLVMDPTGALGVTGVMSYVQASVLSSFRTGDPTVDAILTTLMVTVFAYLSSHAIEYWHKLKSMMKDRHFRPNKQSLTIEEWSTEEDCPNPVYTEFIWYISFIDKPRRGDLKVYRSSKQELLTHPVDDQKCSLKLNDTTYTYNFWTHKSEHTTVKGLHVEVTSDHVGSLLDLVSHIRHTYDAQRNAKKWEQSFLTPIPSPSSNGVQYWSSRASRNKKTMDTIALDADMKEMIVTDIERFLASEEWYQKLGLPWNRGYMLCGPPGCGKTTLIKALSFTYELDIYYLSLGEVASDEALKSLFGQLPARCMLVLEDVDCMTDVLHRRDEAEDLKMDDEIAVVTAGCKKKNKKSDFNTLTLSAVLNLLDGVVSSHGRVLVMTSNHPEKLDPALLRPGRCDVTVTLGKCSISQIKQFYKIYFGSEPASGLFDTRLDNLLTPAQVSGIFLAKRFNSKQAVAELHDICIS